MLYFLLYFNLNKYFEQLFKIARLTIYNIIFAIYLFEINSENAMNFIFKSVVDFRTTSRRLFQGSIPEYFRTVKYLNVINFYRIIYKFCEKNIMLNTLLMRPLVFGKVHTQKYSNSTALNK